MTYSVHFIKNTGFGLAWSRSHPSLSGASFDEVTRLYEEVQHHNKTLGWWSISMLIWNGISIRKNRKAYEKVVAMEKAETS